MEEITIQCQSCYEPFDTLLVVNDGRPYDFCCSMKCYNEYHTIENSGTLEEYKRQKTSNSVEPVNIRKISENKRSNQKCIKSGCFLLKF